MSDRMQRIDELFMQELSHLIELDAETLGFVAVVAVNTTRDLATTTVYVRPFAHTSSSVVEKLQVKSGEYRRALLKRLNLKRIPYLTFALDQEAAKIDRVEALLDQVTRIEKSDN